MDVRTSENIDELAMALAEAQREFSDVKKGRTATIKTDKGTYSYNYADLADVLSSIREPLAKNGLAVVQPIILEDGRPYLVTRLLHNSGQWLESVYPLHTYDRPQNAGSELSFMRRYSLCSLLGIAAEEDDDGRAAQEAQPQKPPKKQKREPTKDEELRSGMARLARDHDLGPEECATAIAEAFGKTVSTKELEGEDLEKAYQAVVALADAKRKEAEEAKAEAVPAPEEEDE